MKTGRPSQLEMTILALLWERGAMTARQVLESLPDGKKRAYTSVLSVLQAMERKGFVDHTSEGGANVYAPTVARETTLRPMLRDLVRNLFGGNTVSALQYLMQSQEVGPEELESITRLVEEYSRDKE